MSFSTLSQVDPDGYNTFYYPNGNRSSEGNMKNGKPDGYWKTYYENGLLKSEGNRKNLLLDSIWKFYSEDGMLHQEITYLENKKEGPTNTFSPGGKLIRTEWFENNVQSGESIDYFEDGKVKKVTNYRQNKIDGPVIEYANDGRIITLEEFSNGYRRSREEINRLDENGEKQGTWKEFYADNKVKWEGEYTAGHIDGLVKEYERNGGIKRIEKYIEGSVDEEAEETIFVELHREYFPDGSIRLIGGYGNGMKQGIFREFNQEGDIIRSLIYKDDIKMAIGRIDTSGNFQGDWQFFYNTGELKAKGKFVDDKKVEEWKYFYQNGELEQKGSYIDGKEHGPWTWWYLNKQIRRTENYRKGKEDGVSMEYDTLGNVLTSGEYLDGIREGSWFYNVGDHTEEGNYIDGLKHGIWTFKYNNDKLNFKGEYNNGYAVGKHRYYHPNGKVEWEGKYVMGNKEGEWKKYDEFGVETLTIFYKNGVEYKFNGYKIKPAIEP